MLWNTHPVTRAAPFAIPILMGLAAAVVACSSVPEVVFRDSLAPGVPDATTTTNEDASSGFDGGLDGESPEAAPSTYSCPLNPPPNGTGVCCEGNRLCLGCRGKDPCAACKDAVCGGGNICCGRGQQDVVCTAQSSCN
jgi:hypothetical protein